VYQDWLRLGGRNEKVMYDCRTGLSEGPCQASEYMANAEREPITGV